MENIKIGFYGYGTRALDALMEHPDFTVLHFLTPGSRICGDVYEAERKYRKYFPMVTVANRRELAEAVGQIDDVSCFLMNASPIILDETVLGRMDFYNIHPGSLRDNRGHHPHLWSILLDEKETEINLHQVTTEIDLGKVIEMVKVPVLPDDTALTLLDRAEDEIPALLTSLAAYLRGERPEKDIVLKGGYRRQMSYEDYRFDPETDTLRDMDRKIRARAMHSGGFFQVGDRRIYADRILSGFDRNDWNVPDGGATLKERETESGTTIVGRETGSGMTGVERETGSRFRLVEKGGTVELTRGGNTAVFAISKITDREGKLIWKRGG